MKVIHNKGPIILVLGDILALGLSLFASLLIRYRVLPSYDLVNVHLLPFSIIFVYSLVFIYVAGLYGRAISISRSSLPGTIIKTQIINGLIAVLLFYFIPAFVVTPKITLFIYIGVSILLMILWRLSTYHILSLQKKLPALVIGSGREVDELIHEMKANPRIGIFCSKQITLENATQEIVDSIISGQEDFTYIVADMNNPKIDSILPELYRRFFPKVRIIDLYELYENVFYRIPLSCMNYGWIMTNVSSINSRIYDFLKRLVDIILGIIVGFIACLIYPFIAIAIKIEDGGDVLIAQERIGKNGLTFRIHKFRSMQKNDSGKWLQGSDNKVTKVGYFIRKTRLDEFPQALAILRGDMSLIGPRADIIDLGKKLELSIPYYSIRTVANPGLTGWAQVNQDLPPQSIEETKLRLAYDLYYIKHRSIYLDSLIILKTLRTLLSRQGM